MQYLRLCRFACQTSSTSDPGSASQTFGFTEHKRLFRVMILMRQRGLLCTWKGMQDLAMDLYKPCIKIVPMCKIFSKRTIVSHLSFPPLSNWGTLCIVLIQKRRTIDQYGKLIPIRSCFWWSHCYHIRIPCR